MVQGNSGLKADDKSPSLFRVIDIAILFISLLIVMTIHGVTLNNEYLLLLAFNLAAFLYLSEAMQLYKKLRLGQFSKRIFNVFSITTLTFLLVTSFLFLLKEGENFSRFVVFTWYLTALIGFIGWRIAYRVTKRNLYKHSIFSLFLAAMSAMISRIRFLLLH